MVESIIAYALSASNAAGHSPSPQSAPVDRVTGCRLGNDTHGMHKQAMVCCCHANRLFAPRQRAVDLVPLIVPYRIASCHPCALHIADEQWTTSLLYGVSGKLSRDSLTTRPSLGWSSQYRVDTPSHQSSRCLMLSKTRNNSEIAVISFDLSSVLTWPNLSPCSLAQALTM
jgi:hypothetical protein